MKGTLENISFFVIGLFIMTLGISATIVSGLGASPLDALNVGLTKHFGLTVGSWEVIGGIILVFLNAWIQKSKPSYFAIVTAMITGIFIDFWLFTLWTVWEPTGLLLKASVLGSGLLLLGLGISIYLHSNLALIPVDGTMIALHKRYGYRLAVAKTIAGVFILMLALIAGGPVGIGTLIVVICVGPIIGFFDKYITSLKQLIDSRLYKCPSN
ncbi:YczE/YyaS/YitT family protein [Pseudalkalibacillus salsuginis]|uniref:YczE/YyaS/YitT family protein n=1 Tax=Pseudalkalibacillus salsuginis TaxID=2910972 RepID=UPI001F1F2D4D|nr:membrane protein [Pseudalkalibacillus salsuginis]MCF6409953.1 membrane protein [Pseudalkalibacillus salsuginis]